MFGLRNKEQWLEKEEALKTLDREIVTAKNATFDGRKERELYRTVQNECAGVRRDVVLTFLPLILRELYDRVRRLYEENEQRQVMAIVTSRKYTARDWFDLVFVLNQLAESGDEDAEYLAGLIVDTLEKRRSKEIISEGIESFYEKDFQSVEVYLNRFIASPAMSKRRLKVYERTSTKAKGLRKSILVLLKTFFALPIPAKGEGLVHKEDFRPILMKLEDLGEYTDPILADVTACVEDYSFISAYFNRMIDKMRNGQIIVPDSSFNSNISKIMLDLDEVDLWELINSFELPLPAEKLQALAGLSKESMKVVSKEMIWRIYFEAKEALARQKESLSREENQAENYGLDQTMKSFYKRHPAKLVDAGIAGIFEGSGDGPNSYLAV